MWTRIVCVAMALVLFCGISLGEDVEKIECKGKVVDTNGQPVQGALVRLYEQEYIKIEQGKPLEINGEQKTGEDGKFSFSVARDTKTMRIGTLMVEKEGFALGWQLLSPGEKREATITLGEPNELAGVVVDTNGQPIADAEVGIMALVWGDEQRKGYLGSAFGPNYLRTRTDETGRFVFKKIPSGAKAEFIAKKAGRATTMTIQGGGYDQLKYVTGQADIKIVMPIEAVIEGRVVEKETQKGVPGVRITTSHISRASGGWSEPIVSGDDGEFRIDGLPAGKIALRIGALLDKPVEWVAQPVEVTTEEGKTAGAVEIKVSRGSLLEVTVTEAESKRPISQAQVSVRGSDQRQYFAAQSDSNGLAQIRLSPGEYVLEGAYHQNYSRERTPETVTIEQGKTMKLTIEMGATPKLRGVVCDGSGKPVEGAQLRLQPMSQKAVNTDANGQFEMPWDRRMWGGGDIPFHIVVQAKKENLGWTGPVEEETNQIDIKLTPAVTYTGRVVDSNGKAIAEAKITLMARFGNYGSNLGDEQVKSDKEGRFELKCVPQGLKCSVSAQADGYGKEQVETESDDAVDGRLDVGELRLRDAPLMVTGIVVDVNDTPVANVRLYCYGRGQPERSNVTTDTKGRFIIDKVCEGELQISANSDGQPYRYGSVRTEGGATDVKIVISEQGTSGRSTPKKPASLAGKAMPAMDNFGFRPSIGDINDKPLLLCFFDIQQRPSRQTLKDLMTATGGLNEKGIVVAAVQCSAMGQEQLDEQLKKMGATFAVGMIAADEEKVKFAWGVDGLPWLILTDKKHIVKANGFDLAELNEKLKELDK